ncbi:MAG: HEAT repeat domain-containing protein [Candidatus Hodarchaeota archaeon]
MGSPKKLSKIDKEYYEEIEHLINDLEDEDILWRAEWDCGKIDESAIKLLIEALKSEDLKVREKASKSLVQTGKPTLEPLINALKDKDKELQRRIASILSQIGKPAIEPLQKALKDKDSDVRKAAKKALEEIKTKKS